MSDDVFFTQLEDVKNKISIQCKCYKDIFSGLNELSLQLSDEQYYRWDTFKKSLNDGEFRIVFSGLLKAGKSCCINEFFNGDINLPSLDTPTTSYCTVLFHNECPVLYSKNISDEKQYHNFNGKDVPLDLVGRSKDNEVDKDNKSYDLIYYVGIKYDFLRNNLVVVDSPGYNESNELSDSIPRNLVRLNPQILVYVYDCGAGLIVPDHIFLVSIFRVLRKDIRTIYLFNKYDVKFCEEPTFDDYEESQSTGNSESGDVSDSEDETKFICENAMLENYNEDLKKHYRDIEKMNLASNINLFGYSSKIIQNFRKKEKCQMPFFKTQHLVFFRCISSQVNTIIFETLKMALNYLSISLFNEFKSIYIGILKIHGKFTHKTILTDVVKLDLLKRYDRSHASISKLKMSQITHVEFYSSLMDIIRNHSNKENNHIASMMGITKALGKFLTDRYINTFSNMFNNLIDSMTFHSLCDSLRFHDLDKYYSHSTCILRLNNDENPLEMVIKEYFEAEIKKFLDDNVNNSCNSIYNLKTVEGRTLCFKNCFNYKIESLWPHIFNYVNKILEKEKSLIQTAIEKKSHEINQDFVMTQTETDCKIEALHSIIKLWYEFNNKLLNALTENDQIPDDNKKVFKRLINGEFNNQILTRINIENTTIFIKKQIINFSKLSCSNDDFFRYFLRKEYFSAIIMDCLLYFNENTNEIFYITTIDSKQGYYQLQDILPKLSKSSKNRIITWLIEIITSLNVKCLPIINFNHEMIFCQINDKNDLVKIIFNENVTHCGIWTNSKSKFDDKDSKESLILSDNGKSVPYPFNVKNISLVETTNCMIYSILWIIIMVYYGNCQPLIDVPMIINNRINFEYRRLLDRKIQSCEHIDDEMYKNINLYRDILENCVRRPFKEDNVKEIIKKLNNMKTTLDVT